MEAVNAQGTEAEGGDSQRGDLWAGVWRETEALDQNLCDRKETLVAGLDRP